MLVELPYVYSVRGILAGERLVKDHFVADWVSVKIEELSGSDAPVSMSWKWSDAGHETCVRWIDGVNFRPSDHSGGEDAAKLVDLRGSVAQAVRDRSSSFGFVLSRAIFGNTDSEAHGKFSRALLGRLPTHGEVKFRQVVSSDREEVRAGVLRTPERMVIVDGRIWLRGGEPCYMLSDSVPGRVMIHSEEIHYTWDVRTSQFYRADRLEDVVEAARLRWPAREIRVPNIIDVLIHDAVAFDDDAEAVRRGGRQVMELVHRDLMEASSEVTRTWVDLKEALSGRPEESVEALEGLSAQYREGTEVRAICEHVLRRWAMRPLEVGGLTPR